MDDNQYKYKKMNQFFQISHNKEIYTNPINFHSHDFYEIYFFMDGNVTYYIENESYNLSKGDVLIIPPGKLHRPVIAENIPYERCVLWLYGHFVSSNEGIRRLLEEIMQMILEKNTRLISFAGDTYETMVKLFDKLLADFRTGEELDWYTAESCMVLILGEILADFKRMKKVDDEPGDMIKQVISYINANITNAPSLEQLSKRFFVSKYYLSHRFKEYTKTTIHQYILMKKINLAKELLEKGEAPKEVCDKCGFSTYANFYKVFQGQTGISPRNYGKREKEKSEVASCIRQMR